MADPILGGKGGSEAFISSLVNASQNQANAQNQAVAGDEGNEEAHKAALLKKMMLQKKAEHAQHKQHDMLVKDRSASQRLQDAQTGRSGPGAAAWSTSGAFKKLAGPQQERFLSAVNQPESRAAAQAAGHALADVSQAKNFNSVLPTAPSIANLQGTLLKNPGAHKDVRAAIDHPFMGDRKGDLATKQNFLQHAAKYGDSRGISVRLGGDMLGTLSGTRVPGFAQQASMRMMARKPDNALGVSEVDAFAKATDVPHLSDMVRGVAIKVLANADGAKEVRAGLQEVTQDPKFSGLIDGDKQRWLTTLGQTRGQDLRSLTDQSLIALRSADFPAHSAQVSRFLTGLSREVSKNSGKDGSAKKAVDARGLLKAATGSGMPRLPVLTNTQDMDEEEAHRARSENRAQVMRYYTKLNERFDGIEKQIDGAKYYEDINLLTGLRAAEPIDLSSLNVRKEALASIGEELDTLGQKLQAREITRDEYKNRVGQVQTQALARSDLTADEKTFVQAQTNHARMGQQYLDLAGKKNRKMRQVGKNLMPPAKRRRLAQERRLQGAQPRYIRTLGPEAAASGARPVALPTPGSGAAVARLSPDVPTTLLPKAQGASPQAIRAAAAQLVASAQSSTSARMAQALAGMDAGTSDGAKVEQMLQAMPKLFEEMQLQTLTLVGQMMSTLAPAMQAASRAPIEAVNAQTRRPATLQALVQAGMQPKSDGASAVSPPATTQGRTDGYGIPRTFERDLGARAQTTAVRPAVAQGAAKVEEELSEVSPGDEASARILKPTTQLRDMTTLYDLSWKALSKPETAVLRNLGWDHTLWNAKGTGPGYLPPTYRTPFESLNTRQRAAVSALGLSHEDWNASVQALGGPLRK